jgi:hypothetical protein
MQKNFQTHSHNFEKNPRLTRVEEKIDISHILLNVYLISR